MLVALPILYCDATGEQLQWGVSEGRDACCWLGGTLNREVVMGLECLVVCSQQGWEDDRCAIRSDKPRGAGVWVFPVVTLEQQHIFLAKYIFGKHDRRCKSKPFLATD